MDEEFSAEELARIRTHQEEETRTSFLAKILSEKGAAWASLVVSTALLRIQFAGAKSDEELEQVDKAAMSIAVNIKMLRPNDIVAAGAELMNEVNHFLQIGMKEFLKGAEDGAGADES